MSRSALSMNKYTQNHILEGSIELEGSVKCMSYLTVYYPHRYFSKAMRNRTRWPLWSFSHTLDRGNLTDRPIRHRFTIFPQVTASLIKGLVFCFVMILDY